MSNTKAGVAIDNWKLPIFEKLLKDNGYTFDTKKLTEDTLLLTVENDSLNRLSSVLREAQLEAQRIKKNKSNNKYR